MNEITAGVNWIAVIIGAVLSFGLGALWYSPKMFGTKWLEGAGLSSGNQSSVAGAMTTQAIGTLLLAWVVGVTAASNALVTMVLIMLTITFLIAANGSFARKSWYAIATESGFVVAMTVVMIACHALL